VLFLDIVGYSRSSTSAQGRLLKQLNAAVSASTAFAAAQAAGDVQPIPTGDGMVLLFASDVIAPAQCAVEVCRALDGGRALPVRMGIHCGLVQRQIDIAGHENVVGEGINTAQRVMDFGDAGHILLSAQYAAWLRQFDDWTPFIHPLGEGTAKHDQQMDLYSLHGPEYGRGDPPARLGKASAGASPSARAASSRKVALLYKPSLQPDEDVLRTLEAQLRASGYEVFVDNEQKINAAWARAIEEPIRGADAVIAIVSPRSRRSEMLEFEIETAHDQQLRTGKPLLLPVIIGEAEPLEGTIEAILRPLDQFVWTGPQDDQKLVAELLSAIAEPLKPRAEELKLEPVGGAVPPDSPFYVRRTSDQEFMEALEAGESLLLVKGARQIGKTSMLAQGARRARELGWRQGLTDFQKFNTAQIAAEERFYKPLAATLARQLRFEYDFETGWDDLFGANLNRVCEVGAGRRRLSQPGRLLPAALRRHHQTEPCRRDRVPLRALPPLPSWAPAVALPPFFVPEEADRSASRSRGPPPPRTAAGATRSCGGAGSPAGAGHRWPGAPGWWARGPARCRLSPRHRRGYSRAGPSHSAGAAGSSWSSCPRRAGDRRRNSLRPAPSRHRHPGSAASIRARSAPRG
jgi:class 3 adenylate cyclase